MKGNVGIQLKRLQSLSHFVGLANVQGEEQKKLDILSNDVFVKALISSGRTVSPQELEEDKEANFVDPALHGRYCVTEDKILLKVHQSVDS
ncbi:hypothetical protein MKW98_014725 [Papaver atlanticum]|uniref:Fructose-1-6-bisphosphatase class I N-terminal domain-containing protein n=1 Tax=Papaver atlanticum TaxID=357466 RepID=A0AAD4SF67_9MAGN|nr:hypothetical protein MKW98_014725 [Papaver atlanticum]